MTITEETATFAVELPENPHNGPYTTVGQRVQESLFRLSHYGVTAEDVQSKCRFSNALWARVTSPDVALEDIETIELACLADALLLDTTYLISGDRRYSVQHSPFSLARIVDVRYPMGQKQSNDEHLHQGRTAALSFPSRPSTHEMRPVTTASQA